LSRDKLLIPEVQAHPKVKDHKEGNPNMARAKLLHKEAVRTSSNTNSS